jgi:3-(3-hydroxy-phenyl)propionate hydroxylase
LQKQRAFLLGDAAHVMPPFGSSGMNTGARDANNLCWKIALVLSGLADQAILDSYDPERRPQIEAVVRYSVLVGRLANIRSWPLALLRDAFFATANLFPGVKRYFREMRYMPKPLITCGLIVNSKDRSGLVGRVFPRLALRDGEMKIDFDALCGNGFALIGIDVDDETLQVIAGISPWNAIEPACVGVRLSAAAQHPRFTIEDVRQAAVLAAHAGKVAVIRPDRYVAVLAPADEMLRKAGIFGDNLGLSARGEPRPFPDATYRAGLPSRCDWSTTGYSPLLWRPRSQAPCRTD